MTTAKLDRIDEKSLVNNPRATRAAWYKYEPVVLAAFHAFPQPFTFTPKTLRPVTFVSRIRDAIRGRLAFDYPSVLNKDELATWFSQVIFKVVGESSMDVYIGPRDKITTAIQPPTAAAKTPLSFETLSFDEICAFALLLSNGRLAGPVVIQKPPLDLSSLPHYPNFHVLPRPDGSLVLL